MSNCLVPIGGWVQPQINIKWQGSWKDVASTCDLAEVMAG
jgi:hypothetical protein